jgi:hypothetical protein
MSDTPVSAREELAGQIRKALGKRNDDGHPVATLVSQCVAALTAQAERVKELEAFVQEVGAADDRCPHKSHWACVLKARALLERKT